jgi:hypothetical protein
LRTVFTLDGCSTRSDPGIGWPWASSLNRRYPTPIHTADRIHVAQNVDRDMRRTTGSAVIG